MNSPIRMSYRSRTPRRYFQFVAAPALLYLMIGVPPAAQADLAPLDKPISLDLQETDLENFVRIIAEFSGYNIVMVDPLTDKVTFRITDIGWSKVFDSVLKSKGLTKLVDGNVIRVAKIEKIPRMLRRPPGFYKGRLISLDLQDTDLDNALRIIEEVSDIKIARSSADVEGKRSTLRLIDVPWDQCLDIIVEEAGVGLIKTDGGYTITSLHR